MPAWLDVFALWLGSLVVGVLPFQKDDALGNLPPEPVGWAVLFLSVGLVVKGLSLNRSTLEPAGKTPVAGPGWIARWRARGKLSHPARGGVAVGYVGAVSTASLSWREFKLGGLVFGAPGSGKTTILRRIVQAAATMGSAAVVIDPKGSRELRRTVAGLGGVVWTIGGPVKWSPLEDDPEVMAEQLLEGEQVDGHAPRVFRDGAGLAIAQLGQALRREDKHPDVAAITQVLRNGQWAIYTRKVLGQDYKPLAKVEAEGVQTFASGLTRMVVGPAGRSLGNGSDAFRLRELVKQRRIVLFSLDTARLPDATRRVAGWAFLAVRAMLTERLDEDDPVPCLVMIDEAHRVGWTARLAVDILALGREADVPVVLASQGPSDFVGLGHQLLERMVQDAGWRLIFRQGELDSARASRMLGARPAVEGTVRTDGVATAKRVEAHVLQDASVGERSAVGAAALENLMPGTAWLRVPPVERRKGRVQCVRVALPDAPGPSPTVSVTEGVTVQVTMGTGEDMEGEAVPIESPAPSPPAETARQKAIRRIHAMVRERGPDECWPIEFPAGMKGTDSYGYPRLKVDGKAVKTYQLIWEEANGERADGESVDHRCHNEDTSCPGGLECPHKLCHNLAHLTVGPHGDNNRRKEEQRRERTVEEAERRKEDEGERD